MADRASPDRSLHDKTKKSLRQVNGIVVRTAEDKGVVYTVLCYDDIVIVVGLGSCCQCEGHFLAIWQSRLACVT